MFSVCRAPTLIFDIRFYNCGCPHMSFKVTLTWLRQIRSCLHLHRNALDNRILFTFKSASTSQLFTVAGALRHHPSGWLYSIQPYPGVKQNYSRHRLLRFQGKSDSCFCYGSCPSKRGQNYSVTMGQDVIKFVFHTFTWYLSVACHTCHLCQHQQKKLIARLHFWLPTLAYFQVSSSDVVQWGLISSSALLHISIL